MLLLYQKELFLSMFANQVVDNKKPSLRRPNTYNLVCQLIFLATFIPSNNDRTSHKN